MLFGCGAAEARRSDFDGNEARESGRGRSANTPSEIPAPGWKDILLRIYRGISEDRISG